MKVTLTRTELSRIVTPVAAMADSKPTKPYYEMLKLSAESGKLTTLAGNGLTFLSGEAQADVQEEGIALVKAKDFSNFVSLMREGPLTITVADRLSLSGSGRRYTLSVSDLEYPESQFCPESAPTVELSAEAFIDALSAVVEFVNPIDSHATHRAHIEWSGSDLKIVGADGKSLAVYASEAAEYTTDSNLPLEAVKKVLSVLKDGKIFITCYNSSFQLEYGDFVLVSRLGDPGFPAWRAVAEPVLSQARQCIHVAASGLKEALRSAAAVHETIDLYCHNGKLGLACQSSDHGEYDDTLDDQCAEFTRVRLDNKALRSAITAGGTERVELHPGNDALDPFLVKAGKVIVIIAPIKQ